MDSAPGDVGPDTAATLHHTGYEQECGVGVPGSIRHQRRGQCEGHRFFSPVVCFCLIKRMPRASSKALLWWRHGIAHARGFGVHPREPRVDVAPFEGEQARQHEGGYSGRDAAND